MAVELCSHLCFFIYIYIILFFFSGKSKLLCLSQTPAALTSLKTFVQRWLRVPRAHLETVSSVTGWHCWFWTKGPRLCATCSMWRICFLWSSVFRFYISFLVKPFKASPVMETTYTHSNDFDRFDSPGRSTIKMIRNEYLEKFFQWQKICVHHGIHI